MLKVEREKKNVETNLRNQIFVSFELSLASMYIGQDNGICTRWRWIVISYTNDDSIVVIAMSRTRWTWFSRDRIVRLEQRRSEQKLSHVRGWLFLDASTGSRTESGKTEWSLRDRQLPFALLRDDGETIPYLQIGWHFLRFGEYIWRRERDWFRCVVNRENFERESNEDTRTLERSFACSVFQNFLTLNLSRRVSWYFRVSCYRWNCGNF